MAPAAPIRSATSAAAASKRPPASDADDQLIDSHHQVSHGAAATEGDDAAAAAAHKGQQPKQQQQQLECPRCQSTNTKFCYYNNYSTAQPRHFCRACRRYWTHGGTLRDVPLGGASRRPSAKRRKLSSAAEAAEPSSSSASASASPPASAGVVDAASAYLPDLSAFPFLSDGSFLPPQFDLGAAAPAAFSSWPHSVVPDFYDGLAPWDDGTVGVGAAAGITGAWGDIAGLELSWPPPGN